MALAYKTLLKDILIFGLGNLGTKLVLFLMVPLYTNFMSDSEFGIADLVFTIAQLLDPILSIVIYDAVIRFGLSKDEKRENVILVGLIILGLSLVSGLALVPIIGLYKSIAEWKWYLYIYVISTIAGSVEFNYLKAKGRNKLFALLSIIKTALMAALNVYFLVYRSMGVQGYLLAYILSSIITDGVLIFATGIIADLKRASFDSGLLKRMVYFSFPLIMNNISWWVIHSSDKVM